MLNERRGRNKGGERGGKVIWKEVRKMTEEEDSVARRDEGLDFMPMRGDGRTRGVLIESDGQRILT